MAVKKITIINRENKTFKVSDRKPLLKELRTQGLDLPYGCEYGGCITCAAKLIKGEIDQRSQVALNNRQINDGYVVLCVAKPKTDCEIEIGVESHDKLYRNPFLDPLAPHELKADIATLKEEKISIFDEIFRNSTYFISGSFFLSSVIQFFLARIIITVDPGHVNFNDQVGTMTWMSYFVVMIPCMSMFGYAVYKIMNGLAEVTGLKREEILNS